VYLALDTIPLLRGYHYLLYSPWLVGWAGLGLLVSARGPIGRRVMRLGLWSVCGAALAAAICLSPLRAEYHWTSAVRSESRGEWAAARRSLDKAVTCCPEFERLWRTRRLVGQLDFRQGYSSRARQLWQIDQWMRNNEYAKAISMMDRIVGSPQGNLDLDRFASRVFTQVGLSYWGEGRWTAAGDMWRKATTLDPERWNSRFFLGTVLARMDRSHPELVDAEFSPLLTHMADRVLRADILASLGDAYFDAGQMEIARQHYEESLRAFELPKDINYRARRGLVGM
jgi:tetratricopeptide (TPR) repeat protein